MITGVSLGGAVAAIATYDLLNYLKSLNIKPTFDTYTYGQPRIGNKAFAEEINLQTSINRIILRADPFPHLPPRSSLYFNPGT